MGRGGVFFEGGTYSRGLFLTLVYKYTAVFLRLAKGAGIPRRDFGAG